MSKVNTEYVSNPAPAGTVMHDPHAARFKVVGRKLTRVQLFDREPEPLIVPERFFKAKGHVLRRDARGRFIKPVILLDECARGEAEYAVALVFTQLEMGRG